MSIQDLAALAHQPDHQMGSGLELIQAAVIARLIESLPMELDRQAANGAALDAFIEQITQRTATERMTLPAPPAGSYYPGSRPSTMNLPVDQFPIVVVMADSAGRDPEDVRADSSVVFLDSLYVEIVVCCQAVDDTPQQRMIAEGVTDRRAKRSVEAIVKTLQSDAYLSGLTQGMEGAPRLQITEAFGLRATAEGEARDQRWIFRLGRVDLTVKKWASLPDAWTHSDLPIGYGQ